MRLTTKGRYAVTAMLDLALHSVSQPVSLADISARQAISLSYLEQLFSRLRKAKLVASVRGPGGGYRLAVAPDQIAISAIIDAVNESIDATRCGKNTNCQNGEMCLTHFLWHDLSDHIQQFLDAVSLAQLMEDIQVKKIAQRQQLVSEIPRKIETSQSAG